MLLRAPRRENLKQQRLHMGTFFLEDGQQASSVTLCVRRHVQLMVGNYLSVERKPALP
jgi:hypothetical protein